MSLFTVQTIQKYREAVGDALTCYHFLKCIYTPLVHLIEQHRLSEVVKNKIE